MPIIQSLKRRARTHVTNQALRLLRTPEVQQTIWEIVNRPSFRGDAKRDLWGKAFETASEESAQYVVEHMLAKPMLKRSSLMELGLKRVSVDGLYLEFGSGYGGRTLKFISERVNTAVHGFDSFEGLPEDWFGELVKGSLSPKSDIPDFGENVKLHKGWFSESLPVFTAEHEGDVAFMHVDCDLYSSTKDVFDALADRIVPGTVILFDEYFNYPGWQKHEYKAFQEFVRDGNRHYEYLGYNNRGCSVAVQMQ